MPEPSAERLRELFAEGRNRWIAEKLRARKLRGADLGSGIVAHATPTASERTACDDLLGRRSSLSRRLRVDLASLMEKLRAAGLIQSPEDILWVCFGDVPNRKAEREEHAARWDAVFAEAARALESDGTGTAWLASLQADGLLKRLTRGQIDHGREVLDLALRVWRKLPLPGIRLVELAGQVAGDTHALDRGRAVSPVLLRGIKLRTGVDGNEGAEARRRAWETVGVLVDQLSAPALTFQLRAVAGHPLHAVLKAHRVAGWPAYLSYQSLAGANPFLPLPCGLEQVFVVENPALVEIAASRLGVACRPLICTEGVPASAVKRLLRCLTEAGAKVKARADFDWSGLRILDGLVRELGVEPWRMDAGIYETAPGEVPLEGAPMKAGWCSALSQAMLRRGVAVYEELLAPALLQDLRLPARIPAPCETGTETGCNPATLDT